MENKIVMSQKQKYSVEGMSCDGCRNHVEQALNKVSGVLHAFVNLSDKEAVVESENGISLEQLNAPLAGTSYKIVNFQEQQKKK